MTPMKGIIMDTYEALIDTILGTNSDMLETIRDEMNDFSKEECYNRERLEFYAGQLQALANNLKTAAYYATNG